MEYNYNKILGKKYNRRLHFQYQAIKSSLYDFFLMVFFVWMNNYLLSINIITVWDQQELHFMESYAFQVSHSYQKDILLRL